MTRMFLALAVAGVAMAGLWAVKSMGAAAVSATPATTAPAEEAKPKPPALNFTVKDIDGKDIDLSTYAGKVIMMVNVASLCGNTPQYVGLEELYTKYKDKGFVILAFPANNFGSQEPGTNAQIKDFCTGKTVTKDKNGKEIKYSVTFPLFSKISVKGDDIAPLYKYLITLDTKPEGKGDVKWNFEKFLIGKDGTVVGRFENKTQPSDPKVVAAVEAALK